MKDKQNVNFTIACEDLTVIELADRLDFMANLLRTVLLLKDEKNDVVIDPLWLPESMRPSCDVKHEFFIDDKEYKLSCGLYTTSDYERGKNYRLSMNQALMREILKGGTLDEIFKRYKSWIN